MNLDDCIKCAEREVGRRRAVYPGVVSAGKMRQENADREIATMDVIASLIIHLKATVGVMPK